MSQPKSKVVITAAKPNAKGGQIRYHEGDTRGVDASEFEAYVIESGARRGEILSAESQMTHPGFNWRSLEEIRAYRTTSLSEVVDVYGTSLHPDSTDAVITRIEVDGDLLGIRQMQDWRWQLGARLKSDTLHSAEAAALEVIEG